MEKNRQKQLLKIYFLISFLPSAVFKALGTWTQVDSWYSFHRNIESLRLQKTLHSFTQELVSVNYHLLVWIWFLVPALEDKESSPWHLWKHVSCSPKAPLFWNEDSLPFLPQKQFHLDWRNEADSWQAPLLAVIAPRDWQLWGTSVESWDLCNVGGGLGRWPGIVGPVDAFRARTLLKGLLLSGVSSENLGKYGTVLESTRWQSSRKERMLWSAECVTVWISWLGMLHIYWIPLKYWLANSHDFREYDHQRVNSGIVSSWIFFLPYICGVQQRYCLMMIITLTVTLLEARINRLFKDLKR